MQTIERYLDLHREITHESVINNARAVLRLVAVKPLWVGYDSFYNDVQVGWSLGGREAVLADCRCDGIRVRRASIRTDFVRPEEDFVVPTTTAERAARFVKAMME